MPFTPYHFGPSAFFGLVFRKYLDLPVLLLVNVIVDIEVLVFHSWPVHRYAHTLLIGAGVGLLWGLLAYPLKGLFGKLMNLFRLPYKARLWKMLISGILGVWIHVLIDSFCHWDIKLFWPNRARPLYDILSPQQVRGLCLTFWCVAIILYVIIITRVKKPKKNAIHKHQ
ncbi:MAG: hypothetical protein ACYST2_03645 [Planctomycetota bacterium]|jgi:membrane-bound metal-dependent hydrolase YbcI (DUF457 family)